MQTVTVYFAIVCSCFRQHFGCRFSIVIHFYWFQCMINPYPLKYDRMMIRIHRKSFVICQLPSMTIDLVVFAVFSHIAVWIERHKPIGTHRDDINRLEVGHRFGTVWVQCDWIYLFNLQKKKNLTVTLAHATNIFTYFCLSGEEISIKFDIFSHTLHIVNGKSSIITK